MNPNNLFRKLEEWGSLTNPDRRRAFWHNSLWIGFLPAVAVGFGVLFILCLCLGHDPGGRALHEGVLAGGLNAFCWIIGIWCAVGPDDEEPDGEPDKESIANPVKRYAALTGSVVLLVILIFPSEFIDLVSGSAAWPKTFIGVVLKTMAVACVVIPVAWSYRKR